MEGKFLSEKQKIILYMGIATAAVYLGFRYLLPLFVPFLIAYFISWIVRPLVRFLHKRLKLPPVVGGVISLLLLVSVAGCGLFYLGRMLVGQLTAFLQNLPEFQETIYEHIQGICAGCDKLFRLTPGTASLAVEENMQLLMKTVQTEVVPALSKQSVSVAFGVVEFVGVILIIFVSILLIVKDMELYREKFQNSIFYSEIHKITGKLSETGVAYLKAQGIIMTIIAAVCVAGLLILKNKYALLIGIGIAVFDAFPVLGSGLILVPWAIVLLFSKDFFSAAVIGTIYVACQLIREFLEPRLIGNKIGVPAIGTMMAMYVGVNLFGFAGFFLGPLALIILLTIFREIKKS